MQTTVRVKLSEIDASLLEKLRVAFGKLSDTNDPEVDIVLQSGTYNPEFVAMIEKSAADMQAGNTHVFTMESLAEFARS